MYFFSLLSVGWAGFGFVIWPRLELATLECVPCDKTETSLLALTYISGLEKHRGQRLGKSKAGMQLFLRPCQIFYFKLNFKKKSNSFFKKRYYLSLKNLEYTKSYMVFLLVVQIYVVYSYLVLLVRALYACVWFFLLFVCLNHLVCGCKDQEVHFSPPFCRFVGKHWDVIMQCIS